MKFKKDGVIYDNINEARGDLCDFECTKCRLCSSNNSEGICCWDYCQDYVYEAASIMGLEVIEDEPKKPRLAKILGVEVGERFDIYNHDYNPYFVDEDGYLHDCENDKLYNILCEIINNPDLIKRQPRWTEQEIQDAKAIRRLMSEYTHIKREKPDWGENLLLESEDVESYALSPELFPSIRVGETVDILDIIGGNE